MDIFLGEAIVLPPGDFDKSTLLPIMHVAKMKTEEKARQDAVKAEAATNASNTVLVIPQGTDALLLGITRKLHLQVFTSELKTLSHNVLLILFLGRSCLKPAVSNVC